MTITSTQLSYRQMDDHSIVVSFTLIRDDVTGSVTITFPGTLYYGGVFDRAPSIYMCMTTDQAVSSAFIQSQAWKYLTDQSTGKVFELDTSFNVSVKPSTMYAKKTLLNDRKCGSIKGLITKISRKLRLEHNEEVEFSQLLHQEFIRSHHALEMVTAKDVENIPSLRRFKTVYKALRDLSIKQMARKVVEFGTCYEEFRDGSIVGIWMVTSCSDELFTLQNTTDQRTVQGFKMFNESVSADVFWMLMGSEVLGGITDDNYATMPFYGGVFVSV